MPHDRFYAPLPLVQGETISIRDEEARHLQKVMRKREGDLVEVINGKELLATGSVVKFQKEEVLIQIGEVTPLPSLPLKLTLALAFTQPSHLEFAVEKGTELGVSKFLLFAGVKSQKADITPHQLFRLIKITAAAMKQSGRGDLPSVEIVPAIREWKPFSSPLYFGDFSPSNFPTPHPKEGELTFAIGPESGWSKDERKKLVELGGIPLSLHPYILRAETAAIVAAALFLNFRF